MTVKGKDVVLYLDDAGTMKPICCMRTATLSTTADIAETSTVGSGKWKTFKGMKLSFTISCNGLVSLDTNMTLTTLSQLQINLLPVGFVFSGSDANGNLFEYSGNVLITSIDTPTNYNGGFEYNVQGQGTGEVTVT